jgi:hypothetical protein
MDNIVSMTSHFISLFANETFCRISLDEAASVGIMSRTIFCGVRSRVPKLEDFRRWLGAGYSRPSSSTGERVTGNQEWWINLQVTWNYKWARSQCVRGGGPGFGSPGSTPDFWDFGRAHTRTRAHACTCVIACAVITWKCTVQCGRQLASGR